MTTLIGQRLLDALGTTEASDDARYIKHPAAATCWWRDGMTLDAGSAMIFENNLAHLAHESMRHLVWDAGAGDVNSYKANGWDGGRRDGVIATADQTQHRAISWDRRIARRYGPFWIVADRLTDTGHATLRKVRFLWKSGGSGGSGFTQHLALTPSPAPPSVGGVLAYTSTTNVGDNDQTLTVAAPLGGLPVRTIRCRPDATATRGTTHVTLVQVYAWFGWYNNAGTYRWFGLSIFETR